MGHIVVMGRRTYESIPESRRPLKGRLNIVLTHNTKDKRSSSNLIWCDMSTLRSLYHNLQHEQMFIIGGTEVWREFLAEPDWCPTHSSSRVQNLYITQIDHDFDCDTKFPQFDSGYQITDYSEWFTEPVKYRFITYRSNSMIAGFEDNYLSLLTDITEHGKDRPDRTGTGTRALFGKQLRFDLRHSFPLLTTKFVSWKIVVEELLWFLRGDTNSQNLEERGVTIWRGNTRKEFLTQRHLSYDEGDVGPMYGWVWRHAGAEYTDCKADYRGKGRDQLADVIDTLRKDPYSRRILMTTLDIGNVEKGCLWPCHGIALQFFVHESRGQKWLSGSMLMRSCDSALGLPYNIASYALLINIVAKLVDMHPYELIINMNDTHIYSDHIHQVGVQLNRDPYPFPKLVISDCVKQKAVEDLTAEDFDLIGYVYHPLLKMKMSI